MEMGNPKVLIGGAVITVAAAIYLVVSMRPNSKPAPPKGSSPSGAVATKSTEPQTDPFGAPVKPSTPIGDLGFGAPNPTAKSTDSILAMVEPTKPIESAPTTPSESPEAKPPQPKGHFSPPAQPAAMSEPSLPLEVTPSTPSAPTPSSPQKNEDKPLQPPKKSVKLKAIVRIDSDVVAYIAVDGVVKGYQTASSIGGSIIVKKITDEGVTFECNGRTVTLPVGGSEDI